MGAVRPDGIVQAYHFVGSTLLDGRPVPPDGEWLVHDGPVVLCISGLHASRRPWYALRYAPGETICRVELDEIVEESGDKLVARRRRIVRRADLTADLRAFARQCALDVLHLWDAPDIVRRYLETGDETIREAAQAAAWADETLRTRTRPTVWTTARDAAWVATLDPARTAAREASLAAADHAAQAAGWAAARTATKAKAKAAWCDAWSAARAEQSARFDALCRARLGVEEVV